MKKIIIQLSNHFNADLQIKVKIKTKIKVKIKINMKN